MKTYRIMGLFSNFREAFNAVSAIKENKLPGVSIDHVTTMSPIEHPEIEEVLGERSAPVPKFTLMGATFGISFGFLFLASAQATFLVQPQGGKPVIPIPSNLVLTYEMMILFSVIFTVGSFLYFARMGTRRPKIYSEKISADQIGIVLEIEEKHLEPAKALFKEYQVQEIREEVIA